MSKDNKAATKAKENKTEETTGKVDPNVVPKYAMGKKYGAGTDRNKATYAKIAKHIADNGPATLAELKKLCEDHKDFVGYMQRGGHLVIAQ